VIDSTSAARAARPAAVLATLGFAALAGFQVALALGAPWGRAAWGGGDDDLSSGLRLASAVSAGIFLAAAFIVLGRAGLWTSVLPSGVYRWGSRALVAAMTLSALANFASSSTWERFMLGPLALVLAFLCLVVARGGRGEVVAGAGAKPYLDEARRPRNLPPPRQAGERR
jgi:hypothetical protein